MKHRAVCPHCGKRLSRLDLVFRYCDQGWQDRERECVHCGRLIVVQGTCEIVAALVYFAAWAVALIAAWFFFFPCGPTILVAALLLLGYATVPYCITMVPAKD